MSESVTYRVVTGNRVRDGIPVFFVGNGTWSPKIDDAKQAAADGEEALLAEAAAGPKPLEAIAPYAIEVAADNGKAWPLLLRERIRAFGPTA